MSDKFRRAQTSRHIRIYHRQMQSEAWRHLSGSAVKVLLALAVLEKGDNNGAFFLSVRTGAERTGLGKDAVNRALHELQDKGFIYCATPGGFSRKTPHAACWGLTWVAGPKGSEHRAPSHAYEQWRPTKMRGPRKPDSAVPDIGTVAQNSAPDCPDSADSETAKTAQNCQTNTVLKRGTHNSNQPPRHFCKAEQRTHRFPVGWWQTDYSQSVANLAYATILAAALERPATDRRHAA
ncbi:helix-turn-helix domain-containing protein [Sphingopyxis granuli]|uniref:helix-turn-helix domain-containing protein n=1 Tax=Sphingopyxis granuli TaxID=267128 RepID=UPI001BAF748A|nr:helix-turn-helix domain-containing protein [Sphingopyxis granuli]QUM73778.1 helix-turn-helix domain-containing protein [Sphingopyxis granuli]